MFQSKQQVSSAQTAVNIEPNTKGMTIGKLCTRTLDHLLEGVQLIDFNWQYIYVNNTIVKQSKCRKNGAELRKAPTLALSAISADGGEPGSPNKKLKKTEEGKSSFDGGG